MQDMEAETGTEAVTAQDNTASGQADAQVQAQAEVTQGDTAQTTEATAKTGEETTATEEKQAVKIDLKTPEGWKDKKAADWFKATAETAGLAPEQAQGVFDAWVALQADASDQAAKAQEEASKLLQAEWRKDYDTNLALASKTMRALGGQELAEYLDKSGLGNNPMLIRAFQRAGRMLSEDSFVVGGSGAGNKPERAPGDLPMLNFASMDKT
jgi:hypothetical protein